MNGKERQNQIFKLLREKGDVKIHDLTVEFGVTRETARRDLNELSQSEAVKVVRGGAMLDMTGQETEYAKRLNINLDAKEKIAKRAMELVKDGDTIYLDYGTTSLQIAKALSHRQNIRVVTNSLPIVNYLYKYDDISVFVLGGDVRKNEESLFGDVAVAALKSCSFNIGFFSGSGITVRSGLTNHHRGEATISRVAASQCEKRIVTIDQSKYGHVYPNRVLNLNSIDVLVIDQLTDEQKNELQNERIDMKILN